METLSFSPEELFVRNFINSNRRDRIRYELGKEQKRRECIRSLSEPHKDIISLSKLHFLDKHIRTEDVLSRFRSLGYGSKTPVYVIHYNPVFDRMTASLSACLEQLWFTVPYVMISIDGKVGYAQLESGESNPVRAMLYTI